MTGDINFPCDQFDLQRFVVAQNAVIETVRKELQNGKKTSHWMWFIFPQILGLSKSDMSKHFAISSSLEANDYWLHPVLGTRLLECTKSINRHANKSISDILGFPDDVKFQACMTLFNRVSDQFVFREALHHFFDGQEHALTLQHLDQI